MRKFDLIQNIVTIVINSIGLVAVAKFGCTETDNFICINNQAVETIKLFVVWNNANHLIVCRCLHDF